MRARIPSSGHVRLLKDVPPEIYIKCREANLSARSMIAFLLAAITILIIFWLLISICRSCFSTDHIQNQPTDGKQSIREEIIAAFPVFVINRKSRSPSSLWPFEQENCVICLDEYAHEEVVKMLPRCKHMFHKDCIDKWLHVRSLNCPICRERTVEESEEATRTNCIHRTGGNELPIWAFNFHFNLRTSVNLSL